MIFRVRVKFSTLRVWGSGFTGQIASARFGMQPNLQCGIPTKMLEPRLHSANDAAAGGNMSCLLTVSFPIAFQN